MTSEPDRPVVFCSHSSKDKPVVAQFAERLRADGIDAWLDVWEMSAGDNLVAKINDGLARCTAGLIFFSANTSGSEWVTAEANTLIHQAVRGLRVIPVMLDDQAVVPALLEPYIRQPVQEYEAIRDALLGRRGRPPLGALPQRSWAELVIRLTPAGARLWVQSWLGGDALADEVVRRPAVLRRSSEFAVRSEEWLAELGRAMGRLLFPSESGARVRQALTERQPGDRLDVVFEATTAELLGLPVEATRLPVGGSPLLIEFDGVTVVRRPAHLPSRLTPAVPGPLKILVAIAAPDEGKTSSSVLDGERELSRILSALPRQGAQARVLEVAGLAQLGQALSEDQYHVLHLSGHGTAGGIELEDEDGNPQVATAADLARVILGSDRPLPLVFLACCDPVTGDEVTERLSIGLIERGVSQVVGMQSNVSDQYATELAARFYRDLAMVADAEPMRMLAKARRELELRRRRDTSPRRGAPEYAAATIFCHGVSQPVIAHGAPQPLRRPTVAPPSGPVPQLSVDDLVGRRAEVRTVIRALLDTGPSRRGGVLLRGVGGVGKSAIAGRLMQRLLAQDWVAAAVAGPLDISHLTTAFRHALDELTDPAAAVLTERLGQPADDGLRTGQLVRALRDHPLLLVLDNFEDNLGTGGERFLDEATPAFLRTLLRGAGQGRVLITCRYPLHGLSDVLFEVPVAPLSRAQTRKLILRLPGINALQPEQQTRARALTGGHPRLLELIDAVLRGNPERLTSMAERLARHAATRGINLDQGRADLDQASTLALDLQLLDIALTELLGSLPRQAREVLLQAAVSTVPITVTGLTEILTAAEGWPAPQIAAACEQLADRTLMTKTGDPDDVFIERWTAEGLRDHDDPDRWRQRSQLAAEYRIRQLEESGNVEDAMEAARNFVAAQDHEQAAQTAAMTAQWLNANGYSITSVSFAAEILTSAPLTNPTARVLAQHEADAHEAIGLTRTAERRWRQVIQVELALAQAEPDRADYQRDLSVSYERLGDLMRAVGRGEEAA